MRGNLTDRTGVERAGRSIPACAGEPLRLPASVSPAGVYPRVCGGTIRGAVCGVAGVGLSPRVRGNPNPHLVSTRRQGSIPACAGEPPGTPCNRNRDRVYPRVCGGTGAADTTHSVSWGLSPRVRGNPVRDSTCQNTIRSIPACAGEPSPGGAPNTSSTVYPRVCGGTQLQCGFSTVCPGLSPRVRGNQSAYPARGLTARSIPACAGEPRCIASECALLWVYPRVCGGTCRYAPKCLSCPGLSPRVRGNRTAALLGNALPRSIPACAGEPTSGQPPSTP